MKSLILFTLLTSSIFANSDQSQCEVPLGQYTDLEMVLDQFVLGNGNPNWGDWCFEGEPADVKPCYDELDQWDQWLICSGLIKK